MSMTEKEIYLGAVDRMARMLRECRDKFQLYGDSHVGKVPAQLEKAATNYNLVSEINLTLTGVGELLNKLDDDVALADRHPV